MREYWCMRALYHHRNVRMYLCVTINSVVFLFAFDEQYNFDFYSVLHTHIYIYQCDCIVAHILLAPCTVFNVAVAAVSSCEYIYFIFRSFMKCRHTLNCFRSLTLSMFLVPTVLYTTQSICIYYNNNIAHHQRVAAEQ